MSKAAILKPWNLNVMNYPFSICLTTNHLSFSRIDLVLETELSIHDIVNCS